MNNNFEEDLKKIRYREDRIATETEILNDYKLKVLRKITETQGWENLLNGPYKSKYADNAEELLSNLFFIGVDNKGILRVYDGVVGCVNTHEVLSFNLHNSMNEELEHRRKEKEYFDRIAKMSRCGSYGL
jgi:hypothetical protein